MRKVLFITLALLVLALAGPAAAQSKSNAPLRCHTDLSVAPDINPIGDWFGPITGAIKATSPTSSGTAAHSAGTPAGPSTSSRTGPSTSAGTTLTPSPP